MTDGAVGPKFYTGSDHGVEVFGLPGEKREPRSSESEVPELSLTAIATLASSREDSTTNSIDEEYDRPVEHLHDCTKKAKRFKTTKRRLSPETLELKRQRGAARAKDNQELTSNPAKLYRDEIKKTSKREEQKRWLKLWRRKGHSLRPS